MLADMLAEGPLSGRVAGKQISDAALDELASGILEVHVLGRAFQANMGEGKSQLEKRGKVKGDSFTDIQKAVRSDISSM